MASFPGSSTPPPTHARNTRGRFFIRVAGIAFILAVIAGWVAAGANTGWTKDRVTVMKTDEITGIEYPEYHDAFIPGLELLALGIGLGLAATALTFLRKKSKHTS